MTTALVVLGFVLSVVLLLLLHRRLGNVPRAVARAVANAQTDRKALDALTEAVAARSGTAVSAIEAYQRKLLEIVHTELAAAEEHTRAAEQCAADAAKVLGAAAELVRELHRALDTTLGLTRELRELHTAAVASASLASAPATDRPPAGEDDIDDPDRKTTEVPGPPAHALAHDGGSRAAPTPTAAGAEEGFDDEEEATVCRNRPPKLPAPPPRRTGHVPAEG